MKISADESVLVMISHAKIGDFLLLTPHLKKLQHCYSALTVAVPDILYKIYVENRLLPRIITDSQAKKIHCKYKVDLTYPLLSAPIPAGHIGLNPDVFRKPQHVFASYGEALQQIFPDYKNPETEFTPYLEADISEGVLSSYGLRPFRYFTVHSGSDFSAKNWDPLNFERTIQLILQVYPRLFCVSLVGPQDYELFLSTPRPTRFKSIQAPLPDVVHLLNASLFHVDNDSGIHHLAGVLDVPSISVFGPTGPGSWASAARSNFIHWGGPSCPNHCSGAQMRECTNRACLSSIHPEAVAESAGSILFSYRGIL